MMTINYHQSVPDTYRFFDNCMIFPNRLMNLSDQEIFSIWKNNLGKWEFHADKNKFVNEDDFLLEIMYEESRRKQTK